MEGEHPSALWKLTRVTFLCSQPTRQYGGELILGGVDNQLYSGPIVWAPVTQELYWQIAIQE